MAWPTHDPDGEGVRRAARAAVAIVAATAAGGWLGGGELALFAAFGTFALLVLVEFPGPRRLRAVAYLALSVLGTALVCVGTWVAPVPWLSVAVMFVVALGVTFSGVLSATFAAAGRAALLTLVLPLMAPPGSLSSRLAGWGVAVALSMPAALFLWPPRHYGRTRAASAQVCRAVADRLEGRGGQDEVDKAMGSLRRSYLASAFRPVKLTAGSRALVRVVNDLQWLADRTGAAYARDPQGWVPCVDVLRAAADVVGRVPDQIGTAGERLASCLDAVRHDTAEHLRAALRRIREEPDQACAVQAWQGLVGRRTVAAAAALTGQAVLLSAQADSRNLLAKILGRGLPETDTPGRVLPGATAAAVGITAGFLRTRSAVAVTSVRTAAGLALGVAITFVVPVSHGFWVALGAMSVLRTSALTTGSTVARALAGTVLGFGAGAVLVSLIGDHQALLWVALPLAAVLAAFAPEAVSFTAGQAAFTVLVMVLFNVLSPSGWQIGVVRIENILLGCAVAAVTSVLLWPRGLASTAREANARALSTATRYLAAVVHRVTGATVRPEPANLGRAALQASRTADDALRQHLIEQGGPIDDHSLVIRRATDAARVRQTAEIIDDLPALPVQPGTAELRAALDEQLETLTSSLEHPGARTDSADPARLDDAVVATVHSAAAAGSASLEGLVPLITVAAYLRELLALSEAGDPAGGLASVTRRRPGGPRPPAESGR